MNFESSTEKLTTRTYQRFQVNYLPYFRSSQRGLVDRLIEREPNFMDKTSCRE